MQKIVSVKRKKEKNNITLEISRTINDQEEVLIENVNFNTIKFENIFSLIQKEDENQVLELLKFSIEKLNQIKQFDDYFNKSVEKTLKFILECNIEVKELRDDFDDFYTYIRRFLMTYKPEYDALNDAKHDYYIIVFKILIKFANITNNFLTCLVEHGVFDQIIATIRYINDYFLEKNINNHLVETFAYSLKLMFKLSLQEKYLESANNSFKSLLLKNLDSFLKMKISNIYFEFTETIILSNLLCLFNCFLNEKDKIDGQLLNGLIELCKKLVFDCDFEKQDIKSYKILKNEIDNFINFFQVNECLVSIERFVKFIEDKKAEANINQFIERFHLFLQANNSTKIEKQLNKIDYQIYTQYIEDILNSSQYFDFEKFKIIIENYEIIIQETKFYDLIKFINSNNIYNSKLLYIFELNIFDGLIKIVKLDETNCNNELLTFIFKIFIRKCIIGNDPNFMSKYQNISEFFLKYIKPSDSLIEAYFKFDESFLKNYKNYKDDYNTFDMYAILNENKPKFIFDERIKEEMVKDLYIFYEKYKTDEKNKEYYLFSIKVILEIMFGLVKDSNYSNLEFSNFLKNFNINNNNELLIDFNKIANEILTLIDKQYVFKTNIEELLREFKQTSELDKHKISNILSIDNLESLLIKHENIQEFKKFMRTIISSLNHNTPSSQSLFLKAEYFDIFIKLYDDLKKRIVGNFDQILELNEVFELLIYLIFKIFLRRNLLDSDIKRIFPNSLQNIKNQNMSLNLVKSYFSNQIDKNVIKNLTIMIHTQNNDLKKSEDDVFELNSFEIYEYFNLLFKKNLDNSLSEYLRTEFSDKKCFEVLTKNLVKKTDAYNYEEQLEDILDLKSILKLILNFFKRFNLPKDSNLLVFLKNFKPIDSQYVNLNPLVEELVILLESSNIPTEKNQSEKKVSKSIEEVLENIYESGKYLKAVSDINDNAYTRERYEQIRENLLILVQNSTKFDDKFISKLETELEINKIFYHLIKFYFDFIKVNLIENSNDLLEMIIVLIIKFTDSKDYSINSYQNHDCTDTMDILDYLLNSIINDRTFLFKENLKTIKIIQLFFYLLYKLATSNFSKEILKVKFKRLDLYNDILQRLNFFKKFSCSHLVYILLASLIDKTQFDQMIYNSTGLVNNGILSQFKTFLKYYLFSIHDSIYTNPEFHPNGSVLYRLTNKLNLIDNYCFLQVALHYFADFIEMDSLLQKYFCCLCIDDNQYLNMVFKLFQFSNQNEEKLEAVRIIWLLVINKKIRYKVKNDLNLVDYLKDCMDNHGLFHIRTICGGILYNVSNKTENNSLSVLSNKNNQKREMKNDSDDDDFDTTFVKLSIQESNIN